MDINASDIVKELERFEKLKKILKERDKLYRDLRLNVFPNNESIYGQSMATSFIYDMVTDDSFLDDIYNTYFKEENANV